MASSRFLLSALAIALMFSGAAAQSENLGNRGRGREREREGKAEEREGKKLFPFRRHSGNLFFFIPLVFAEKKTHSSPSLSLFLSSTPLKNFPLRHASRRRQVRVHGHRREDADGTVRQAPGRDDGELTAARGREERRERESCFFCSFRLFAVVALFFFPLFPFLRLSRPFPPSPLRPPKPKDKKNATAFIVPCPFPI